MGDKNLEEIREIREEQNELLKAEGGPNESLSIMYGSLLRKYESLKEENLTLSKRYEEVLASHSDVVHKSGQYQEQVVQYKNSYDNILGERNKYKQQCTQA